jgi:hypothetical protein
MQPLIVQGIRKRYCRASDSHQRVPQLAPGRPHRFGVVGGVEVKRKVQEHFREPGGLITNDDLADFPHFCHVGGFFFFV